MTMTLTMNEVKIGFQRKMSKEYIENGLEFNTPNRLNQAWKDYLDGLELAKSINSRQSLRLRALKWNVKQS